MFIVAMLPLCTLCSAAEETSGVCGDNLTWTYDDKILTICGSGTMYDYSEENPAPWNENCLTIERIIIEEGVTSIGNYAFSGNTNLSYAFIAASVTSVGEKAFASCGNDELTGKLYYLGEAPAFLDDAYSNAVVCNVMIFPWDQSVKQDYGGKTYWREASVRISPESNKLVELNKQFSPEDLIFEIYAGNNYEIWDYIPKQVNFGSYDNSTYGEKTVTVRVDGYNRSFSYFVTDGTNHLSLIEVNYQKVLTYKRVEYVPEFSLKMGKLPLEERTHYDIVYDNKIALGTGGRVTIKGKGICAGFEKTFCYSIAKADISTATVRCATQMDYKGMPLTPAVSNVSVNGVSLTEGTDYEVLYDNNVDVGTATVRIVGKGNYYGEARRYFEIVKEKTNLFIKGNRLGNINDPSLSDDIHITHIILAPCQMRAVIQADGKHVAFYALYRVDGDKITLIEQVQSEPGYRADTVYTYDFSSIYEDAMAYGGEIYLLSYSWVSGSGDVYGGALNLMIPAKVPDAAAMTMRHVKNDGDFRREFLSVSGDDGALGEVQWTSTDETVATVQQGSVTFHKPGTATITARYGDLVQTHKISAEALDLSQGMILYYDDITGKAGVMWNDQMLKENMDYVLTVEKNGNAVTVTATGCGLFTGELVKTFENLDSLGDPHTHSFANSCDRTCNSCDYTRDNDHSFAEVWSKDTTHHWHTCTVCGEKTEIAEHSISPDNDLECTVCGTLWIPGDVDGNMLVNREDVVQLLLHVSMPAAFPIAVPADYTGDGNVSREDVVQLLLHVSMPDAFPLT